MPSFPARLRHMAPAAALLSLGVLLGCQGVPGQQAASTAASAPNDDCLARCSLEMTQCEQRQTLREQDCQAHRDRLAADKAGCTLRLGEHCVEPAECLGPDISICRTQLDDCGLSCREVVGPEPKDESQARPSSGAPPAGERQASSR